MATLAQATDILASVYGVNADKLNATRLSMVNTGMLPGALGRSLPEATPARLALLILALGCTDAERIGALADLRMYRDTPGDIDTAPTLAEAIEANIVGVSQSDAYDVSLTYTTTGTPYAWFAQRAHPVMVFGEETYHVSFVQNSTTLDLAQLASFVQLIKDTAPPFKVTT